MIPGTNSGAELLLEIDRGAPLTLRGQLERGLREAVRSGRLATGTRLPASRSLAMDLGVSRRLIVEVYSQLLAEGYLRTRAGGGTFVADAGAASSAAAEAPHERRPAIDFFPGSPDLAGFPRRHWQRAMRATIRDAPDSAFGYPDPQGAIELRRALAGHLGRVRGVVADPDSIVDLLRSGAGVRPAGAGPAGVADRSGGPVPALPSRDPRRARSATARPWPWTREGPGCRTCSRLPRGARGARDARPPGADRDGPGPAAALGAARVGEPSRRAGDRGRLRRRVPLRPRAAGGDAGSGAGARRLHRDREQDARAGAADRLDGAARAPDGPECWSSAR